MSVQRRHGKPKPGRPPTRSNPRRELNQKATSWITPAAGILSLITITLIALYQLQSGDVVDHQQGPLASVHGVEGHGMYMVTDIPGKGMGVIATRDIQQGELVFREKPLFMVPQTIKTSPTVLIMSKLANVGRDDYEAFFNLSHVNFPKHLNPEGHRAEVAFAIFQTNAVAAGADASVFLRMARLNHGCVSAFNVVYHWREQERTLVVHALKAITKGEELLTAYLDTRRPRAQRRAQLATQYGFDCTCAACAVSNEAARASDARLSAMTTWHNRLATWGDHHIDGVEAINLVRRIWEMGDDEGYWSGRGQLAADAAWVAAAHADAHAVRRWARVATQWYTYELGGDSVQVADMERIRDVPESHAAWGTREPMNVGEGWAPG